MRTMPGIVSTENKVALFYIYFISLDGYGIWGIAIWVKILRKGSSLMKSYNKSGFILISNLISPLYTISVGFLKYKENLEKY